MLQPSSSMGESMGEEGWVVCRVFKKKNYQKTLDSPKSPSTSTDLKAQMLSSSDVVLDHILQYMGKTCKLESNESFSTNTNMSNNSMRLPTDQNTNTSIRDVLPEKFMHLPRLESPTLPTIPGNTTTTTSPFVLKSSFYQSSVLDDMLRESDHPSSINQEISGCDHTSTSDTKSGFNDWVALDRLVASQLNGQAVDTSKQFSYFTDPNPVFSLSPTGHEANHDAQFLHSSHRSNQGNNSSQVYSTENDLWSFTKSSPSPSSSSDPLCHLSV